MLIFWFGAIPNLELTSAIRLGSQQIGQTNSPSSCGKPTPQYFLHKHTRLKVFECVAKQKLQKKNTR